MERECPRCGQNNMMHAVKDVIYTYRGHSAVIGNVKGWHCADCHEVEFDPGEGVRFAEEIESFSAGIDAMEGADLARIRKKLKLTQIEASMLTGGGKNAFSRYERGKAKPMLAVTNLFKLLDKHPELLDELKSQTR